MRQECMDYAPSRIQPSQQKMHLRTTKARSQLMSKIRSRGNKETELRLVAMLRQAGIIGWRRHQAIMGTPDFTFRSAHVVVFVDGCFWHACPLCFKPPKTNRPYWRAKIARNIRRDRTVTRALRNSGWRVIRIWSHQLSKPNAVMARLREAIAS